ncbi:MAG: ribosome maturation factor RimP [Truepera sp.]|nr:ribosome maturation factor RimP [Truepera sp.]
MELTQAAQAVLEPLGFEVLELTVSGRGKRTVLLRIDRLDRQPVALADVELASRVFGLELDRLDPFDSPFKLEVESPGPQRPLLTAEHFRRFQGLAAKVQVTGETFKGVIGNVSDEAVTFAIGTVQRTVALRDIDQARLAEWPETHR